ncbi:MAG TPA: HNH endonuclease [Chitinophagales bacterium]|nr:HNH endonuclease [Chitinophagales bacterium]
MTNQKCIWCLEEPPYVTFNKEAHTFPQSLGGKNICKNVCDNCNHFFGNRTKEAPSIEAIFKEALNISKYILLKQVGQQPRIRHKSEFFEIDWKHNRIKTKFQYRHKKAFQENAGRQFRRGMFKVFLEERERQVGDALNERYDYIREFSRYNLSDYPIFFLKPHFKALPFSLPDVLQPTIRFTDRSDELDKEFRMFEYFIMGHYFSIPTSKSYTIAFDNYKTNKRVEKGFLGGELVTIRRFDDIDFTFNYMQD